MVDYPPDRIAGPRLTLRPPVLDDAGALFQRVARDPEVTKYLLWTPHPDVAATRRVITEKLNVGDDERTWAIALRHSDDVIGLTSCRRPRAALRRNRLLPRTALVGQGFHVRGARPC